MFAIYRKGLGIIAKGENVQVKVELGHKAVKKKQPAKDGFTHDWTVFVRGPDGSRIEHFIERIVFKLHESFPKSKRAVKEPPYHVSESGYAGFNLPIDIYFKNKEEPKKIRFVYDLFLQLDETPVSNIRCEKLTFQNPTEEFKRKLLKAGGVVVSPNGEVKVSPPSQSTTHHASGPPGFTELFGPPIHTETPKKQNKSSTGSKEKDKSSKTKSSSSSSSSKLHTPSNPPSSSTIKTPSSASSTASSSSSSKEKVKSRESYGKRPPSSPLPTHSEAARKKMKCSTSTSPSSQETSKSSKEKEKSKHKDHGSKKSKPSEKESSSKHKVQKSSHEENGEKKEKSKSSDTTSQKSASSFSKSVVRPSSTISRKSISSLSSLSSSSSDSSSSESGSDNEDDGAESSSSSFSDLSLLNISKVSEKRKSIAARGFNAAMKELNALSDDDSAESSKSDSDSDEDSSPDSKKKTDSAKSTSDEKKVLVPEEKKAPVLEERKVPKERKVWDALFSKSKNQEEKTNPEKDKHDGKVKSGVSKHDEKNKSEMHSSKHNKSDKTGKSSKPSSHKSGSTKSEKPDVKDHKSSDKKVDKGASKTHRESKTSSHAKEKERKVEDKLKNDANVNGAVLEEDKKVIGGSRQAPINTQDAFKEKEKKPDDGKLKSERNAVNSAVSEKDILVEKSDCGEDLGVLVELQEKLMSIKDRTVLQKVVDLIEKTRRFSISDKTFDFDLCRLDRDTIDEIVRYMSDCE